MKSEVLRRDRTALPGVANGRCRADERAIAAGKRVLLKIKEERQPPEQSFFPIAKKKRRAPLRATQRAGFSALRIGEPLQARDQRDCPGVIKGRKRLDQVATKAKGGGHRPQPTAVGIEVRAK